MEWKASDNAQLEKKGIPEAEVIRQVSCLQETAHFVETLAPAVDGNGMYVMQPDEMSQYVNQYQDLLQNRRVVKFVPASGAATRMFKKWFQLLENGTEEELAGEAAQWPSYPFYPVLERAMAAQGKNLREAMAKRDYRAVISFMLQPEGLNYGQMPKGLLPFHLYGDEIRTAFEEHWVEGAVYARTGQTVHLHFTVSPEHRAAFQALTEELKRKYEKNGVRYEVGFSEQMPQTDTVSLTEEGKLLRDEAGNLVFRPGGHGSLIHNLNALDADYVFIKNIDNVTVDARKADTYDYKRSLLGLLVMIERHCFRYAALLETEKLSEEEEPNLQQMITILLGQRLPDTWASFDRQARLAYYRKVVNRPIRVCGMVARENEPGGGPFWVRTSAGVSLQIVETAEMDLNRTDQKNCLEQSTYFNPVDLVCGLKNFKGEKFNLLDHVDLQRYFLAEKSYKGQKIKVLEHPGLWNGAMADWNTVFVRVPVSTFTPVKEVRDLLRPAHVNSPLSAE